MARRTASTSEVAAELGLAPATVQKYARDGRIPFGITPGGHRRFDVQEVREALASTEGAAGAEAASSHAASPNSPPSVVILTALDVEYEAVRPHLSNLQGRRLPGGTRFEVGDFSGDFLDWQVAVAEIGEGNVGAAIEAEKAISYFDPDLILFVGVAGGFKDDLRHGDVVVASKVYDYHSGKAQEEFYARPIVFPTSYSLEQLVRKVRRDRWLKGGIDEVLVEQPSVKLKPIAAGQVVIASKKSEAARQIERYYNDSTAVDMESVGMYMAAQRVNRPALSIRGVSDLLDDKTPESDANFQPLASRYAAAFAFALLRAVEPEVLGARATPPLPTPVPSDLLAQVPPNVASELERARTDSPADADSLLRRLASAAELPVELVDRLVGDPPEWLARSTSPRLWVAMGEFAAAHNAAKAAVDAFVRAAGFGSSDAPKWMARATLAAASQDQHERARELIAKARELAGGSHPFVDVIEAAIDVGDSSDASRVSRVLEVAEAYGGDDPLVEMMRGRALLMLKRPTDALAIYEQLLEDYPAHTAAALGAAEAFFARCVMDESESSVRDLERARELALQARDLRRGWRGDSAEAAAVAAEVAIYSGDLEGVLKIALPPPWGGAKEDEAEHAKLLSQASRAVLFTGDTRRALELAEKIPDKVERELAQGDCFRHIPDSGDLAEKAYEQALEAAADDRQRVRAYFGLAKLGKWPLPGVERLADHDAEVVDLIAAEAEVARKETDAAIKRYRMRRQSPRALEGLVNVYLDNDRVDEAVEALRGGAERHQNPELRVRAARVLISAKRYEDAEAEARRAMDAVPAGSRQHRELRKLRVELLGLMDQWPEVEEQARAGLDEGIDIPDMRWALVAARYNRRRAEAALEEMTREPALEPRDEIQADLAIQLYRLGPRTPDGIRKVLDIADRFAASEQVSAAAFMTAIEMSTEAELPASVVGRLRTLQSDFFECFPESTAIVRLQADDDDAMVEKLISHLRENIAPGAQRFEEIAHGVINGRLPYGFLSAFTGRPYAEALIKRAAGFFPVASGDGEVAALEDDAAERALDGPVVAETSALHTLGLLKLNRSELLASFSRILVPAEVLDDALAAKTALGLRSTGMMGWDPRSNRPTLTEVDAAQAEAWAIAAERLVERVRECEVIGSRPPKEQGPTTPEKARPWLTPIETAKSRNLPLYSDDFVLRAAARSEGVAAFGTTSLLSVLVDRDELTEDDFDGALMALRRNRAADLPLDEEQILALADEEGWQAGSAAFSFTRPALWQHPVLTLSLYRKCLDKVLRHDESLLPDWCAAAAVGSARSAPAQSVARSVGAILSYTVLTSSELAGELKARLFPSLLVACRQACQSLGGEDPLPAAAEVLRDMLPEEVGAPNAAQMFAKLVEGLDPTDQTTALEVFLRSSRPNDATTSGH